ncbi:MAG TPA: hypothetical protein VMN79_10645 [Casimicrobiaceae bacterium]|nr:hypothetical protein [Casimicrobiaceae bacterium]
MLYLLRPIERHARRHLATERDRLRFDRARRFVDESEKRGRADGSAYRIHARWLKFLCSSAAVQKDIWPEDADFLCRFAAAFGLPPAQRDGFVGLALLGRLWRAWSYDEMMRGPPELVGRVTRVEGWERFERCRGDGAGVIVLPVHGQFARLFQRYLRHRGHDGLELGITNDQLEHRAIRTPVAKRFELARQMHAAKHALARGGIVFNLPDARQNLDNARSVEFFGRQRRIAAGFAELALKTGAHAIPAAFRFSPRGFFVFEFGEPFVVPPQSASHEERVASLVGQYAAFLREEWSRYPWNIDWTHLRHYLLLPKDDPARGEIAEAAQVREARPVGEGLAR